MHLGIIIGQEEKHRGGVEEKMLLGALSPDREFSSRFRMNSIDHQEHSVTPEVLRVGFCFVV